MNVQEIKEKYMIDGFFGGRRKPARPTVKSGTWYVVKRVRKTNGAKRGPKEYANEVTRSLSEAEAKQEAEMLNNRNKRENWSFVVVKEVVP